MFSYSSSYIWKYVSLSQKTFNPLYRHTTLFCSIDIVQEAEFMDS